MRLMEVSRRPLEIPFHVESNRQPVLRAYIVRLQTYSLLPFQQRGGILALLQKRRCLIENVVIVRGRNFDLLQGVRRYVDEFWNVDSAIGGRRSLNIDCGTILASFIDVREVHLRIGRTALG